MKSLTIWQPWASLIVGSPDVPPQKPVENRSWRPPESLVGERIAIHAGKTMDGDAFHDVITAQRLGPVRSPYRTPGDFPRGAVVGVATLDRVIALQHGRDELSLFDDRFQYISPATIATWGLDADELRFFFGPVGWVFRDRRHLAEPVSCKGAQGLWSLPSDVERAVLAQLARAA